MVASVMVKRVAVLDGRHIYIYGPDDEISGHLTLDLSTAHLYPSDEGGSRTGAAYISLDGKDAEGGTLSDFEWNVFLRATVGIRKKVLAGQEPPDTAHRFFH